MLKFLIYAWQFGFAFLTRKRDPHPFHGKNTQGEKDAFERSRKRSTSYVHPEVH